MMKNRIFTIVTLVVFAVFSFVNTASALDDNAHLTVKAPDLIGGNPNYVVKLQLDAYDPASTDVYYYFAENEAGSRSAPVTIPVQQVGGVGGYGEISFDPNTGPAGKAKVFIVKQNAEGVKTYAAALTYDFSSRTTCTTCPPITEPVTPPPAAPIGGGQPSPTVPTPPAAEMPGVVLDPSAPVVPYDSKLQEFTGLATKAIIAIGIVSSVFLLPYMGILWASGNPENMKKANEWFFSWATGLIFLLLSGVIIRVIGVDILKISP